ncbi:hypothetical protein [Paraburkholderia fungorum]|uniref:hypothetical protein n=1 Tax=Paraburkholderia fungorum TaxID=134537 RepID=UPI0011C49BDA|nr:hypothetical protein [Paraburkholderia fungorum]
MPRVDTRHHYDYNNSTALSQSATSDSVPPASIGASSIVRMTNQTAAIVNGGPSVIGVGYPEAGWTLPDADASNTLRRAIFFGLSGPPAYWTDSLLSTSRTPVRVVFQALTDGGLLLAIVVPEQDVRQVREFRDIELAALDILVHAIWNKWTISSS